MSGKTIAAFERAINAVSDALADQIADERNVIAKASLDYTAARVRERSAEPTTGSEIYAARQRRAQDRLVKLEALRTPLRALGNGFGVALPGPDDQDLLR